MKKLENGYGLYANDRSTFYRHGVLAMFDGKLELVFEGISREDCKKWCHDEGMKMMDADKFFRMHNASFRKNNAKKPFNPADYKVAIIR